MNISLRHDGHSTFRPEQGLGTFMAAWQYGQSNVIIESIIYFVFWEGLGEDAVRDRS